MKTCVLLSLLLALGCLTINGAPVEHVGMEPASCENASTKAAAELALTKINQDRKEGYIFSLHRLSNAHIKRHGENSVVFYLTLDVVETKCSVLSKNDWKSCETRPTANMPVYGQCKAAIFINKVHSAERLYKYNCVIRPGRVHQFCGGCPGLTDHSHDKVQKAVTQSLEKFNQQSGLANRFALLKISRATSQVVAGRKYHVEYTIQETTCPQRAGADEHCPPMECEFAHKGFCKASLFHALNDDEVIEVACEIYEPEAAEREKKLHLLGGETDHSHNDTHSHSHDQDQTHDHAHDHTKCHSHHGPTHNHTDDHDHHHTHDHATNSAHRHAHDHSHDHGLNHDHVHAHHAKAHNHSGDSLNHHHHYKHALGVHTHEHDHELALDHDHNHGHLHEHEHHHHHHKHEHENTPHDEPQGTVIVLPALGQPVTLPSFPDVPVGGPGVGVTLPLKPDPQIPGQMEPTIEPFPTSVSAQCPTTAGKHKNVDELFNKDPEFKPAAARS
uniref:Fetuin B n=1 Tax=Oreochromis niloticus TaxID=8128 RepID=A0A669DJG3_ORENI